MEVDCIGCGMFRETGGLYQYLSRLYAGAFGGKDYPEIVDFGVLEKYRNQGIGTILMDIAEQIYIKEVEN